MLQVEYRNDIMSLFQCYSLKDFWRVSVISFLMFFCIFVAIVRTLASASRISCSGEVVTEDSDAEVIIHKLHSSPGTANGVMTFAALGEKPRSSAKQFDMVRVLAGCNRKAIWSVCVCVGGGWIFTPPCFVAIYM